MMPADSNPACAGQYDLVDAAYERSRVGRAAARELAALCRRCPIATECQAVILAGPEWGVWGATRRDVRMPGSTASGSVIPAGIPKAVA